MKKLLVFLSICCLFSSCSKNPADILLNHKTARAFASGTVNQNDLTKILQAGINSPSGLNLQPWHFTVINDNEYLTNLHNEAVKLLDINMPPKAKKINLTGVTTAIIISGDNSKSAIFDCGIACQSMSNVAVLLGYDTKIFGMQNVVLNGPESDKYRQELSIPDGFTPIALLAIGLPETNLDGLSAATTRKDFKEVVNYK